MVRRINLSDETGIDDLELRYPAMRTPDQKWGFLLSYAVLAPSACNTQPWLWKIENEDLLLYQDATRLRPALDPNGRQAIISCGASLMHLRLALRHYGYAGKVDYIPDESRPGLLARVSFGERLRPTLEEDLLYFAIPRRHTHRGLFDIDQIPEEVLSSLGQEAQEEGVWLHLVREDNDFEKLVTLIARGEEIRWRDAEFRSEFTKWLRPNNTRSHDGIPGRALGMCDLASHLAPLALRFIDAGDEEADEDCDLLNSAPAIAILGTDADSPHDWLKAGEGLARILLRSCAFGLGASFFNQPIELAGLRPQLREIMDRSGFPQLIFRLGYPVQAAVPTPRRTPDEVLTSLPLPSAPRA